MQTFIREKLQQYHFANDEQQEILQLFDDFDITKIKKKYVIKRTKQQYIPLYITLVMGYIIIFFFLKYQHILSNTLQNNIILLIFPLIIIIPLYIFIKKMLPQYKESYSINIYDKIREKLQQYTEQLFGQTKPSQEAFINKETLQAITKEKIYNLTFDETIETDTIAITHLTYTKKSTNPHKKYTYAIHRHCTKLKNYHFPITSNVIIEKKQKAFAELSSHDTKDPYIKTMNTLFLIIIGCIIITLCGLGIFFFIRQGGGYMSYAPQTISIILVLLFFIYGYIKYSKKNKEKRNKGKELENKYFEQKYEVFGENEIDKRVIADPYVMQELNNYTNNQQLNFQFLFTKNSIYCILPQLYTDGIRYDDPQDRLQSIINLYRYRKGIKKIQNILKNHTSLQ